MTYLQYCTEFDNSAYYNNFLVALIVELSETYTRNLYSFISHIFTHFQLVPISLCAATVIPSLLLDDM